MSRESENVPQDVSQRFTLIVIIDMEAWQEAGRLTGDNAIEALNGVLGWAWFHMGTMGHRVKERGIILRLIGGNEEVDSLFKRFRAIRLVGPGREANDSMEAALTSTFTRLANEEKQVITIVAQDHHLEANDPIRAATQSLLTLGYVENLTWDRKDKDAIDIGFKPSLDENEVASRFTSESPDNEREEPAAPQQDAITVADIAPREESDLTNSPVSPNQEVLAVQALLERISILEQRASPAVELDPGIDLLRSDYLDFVPLVKTVRDYQHSLSAKKKVLRTGVALELMDNYSWPIGEEGYTTFRSYTQEAETAGFVHLGDCKHGSTIYSTGRLENILKINPSKNYTQGWPRVY